MSVVFSAFKLLANKMNFRSDSKLERTSFPLDTKVSEVGISSLHDISSSSSSSGKGSSPSYNYSGRDEGTTIYNPIYDDDEVIDSLTETSSILTNIIDSPSSSPLEVTEENEVVEGTMIARSMIINGEDSQEDAKPAFLLHPSALVTGNEWEEILSEEEERLSIESEARDRQSIFGNPDDFIECTISQSGHIREVYEDNIDEEVSSNDVQKMMAIHRCKVTLGLVQSRIAAYLK